MLVISRPRQSGKTTTLIKWMQAAPEGEHRVLVSHSHERAMQLLRRYVREEPSGLESWQFVALDEVLSAQNRARGRSGRVIFAVDDLDLVISRLLGAEVGAVSLTSE